MQAEKINQWVTFQVGQEHIGIPIDYVKGIEKTSRITALPQIPNHLEGVVDIRD